MQHVAWLVAIFVLVGGMFIAAKKVRAPEVLPEETATTTLETSIPAN